MFFINFLLIISVCNFVKSQDFGPQTSSKNHDRKVIITDRKLHEVAVLRDEIQDDVAHGVYFIGRPNEDEVVQRVDQYLKLRSRLNDVMKNFDESKKEEDYLEEINFLSNTTESSDKNDPSENSKIIPNIVESSMSNSSENEKLTADYIRKINVNFKRSQRESLVLKNIKENLNFKLGYDVREWKITSNKNSKILVGRTENSFIFAIKIGEKWKQAFSCRTKNNYIAFEMFSQWNSTKEQIENFIIMTNGEKIFWGPIDGSCSIIWEWKVGKPIVGLKTLQIDKKNYLIVSTDRVNNTGEPSVNIYQFILPKREFFITQMNRLQNPASEMALVDDGQEIILAISQKNSAVIFTYKLHQLNGSQFQKVYEIESENLKTISAFQMGGISYVAISGKQPIILRYYHGKFVPQTILGQGFGLVERFLPVPARTYRDDLILLIQHKIDYESHSISVLEALIWDGEAFQVSHSVPCETGSVGGNDIGLNCIVDFDRNEGIKGATVINDNEHIAIIVPRARAPTGYFEIETELMEENNEYEELERIYEDFSEIMKEYDAFMAETESIIENRKMWNDDLDLETLITPELHFNGEIDKIFLNEYEWTEDDSKMNLKDLVDLIEEIKTQLDEAEENERPFDIDPRSELVESDVVEILKNKRETEFDVLQYDDVSVENLFVETVNDEPIENVLGFTNDELDFNGTVVVSGGIQFLSEISDEDEDSVEVDRLEIKGDLNVNIVNGIPWKELMNDIILTNIPQKLDELEIEGDVIAHDKLTITSLNELNFSQDFLWSSGPSTSIIRGEKLFHNTLSSNAIDTGGLINGVNPFDLITLTDEQFIPGETTFTQLEVSEKLEVNGTVSGKGLEDFLTNPSLLQSKIIDAACFFTDINVNGPIILKGKFNNTNISKFLDDIINKNDKNATITGIKKFQNLTFKQPITILNNSINKISLNDFFTKDSYQEIAITQFNGNLIFNFLELNGLFNSINITELNKKCVKINESQYNDATIIFKESSDKLENIQFERVQVLDSLNGYPLENYQTIYDDLHLVEGKFSNLEIENLQIDVDIEGTGNLNGINLTEFKTKHNDDWIFNDDNDGSDGNSKELSVENVVFENDVNVDSLNNYKTNEIIFMLKKLENLNDLILSGAVQIDNLHVKGNVYVNLLNGKHFKEDILSKVVWLNASNTFNGNIQFLDSIIMSNDIEIEEYLNDNHFQTFLDDIVFKDEQKVTVKSSKIFNKPPHIIGDIELEYINDLPFNVIAFKNKPIQLFGQLKINGNLFAENLQVDEDINDFETRILNNLNSGYNTKLGVYVIDEMTFNESINVENLILNGKFNNIQNIDKLLKNIIFKTSSNVTVSGKKIFKNDLKFGKGLQINKLNDIDLNEFFKNVICRDCNDEIIIYGPIKFLRPVKANFIKVNQIQTSNLMGCELNEWLKNGLRIDKPLTISNPLVFTGEALKGNNLNVVYVNHRPMSDIITLHTPQNITSKIIFSNVLLSGNIHVKGQINEVNLNEEKQNTLMVHGDQHITSYITMQSARVLRNLNTYGTINGKNLKDVAFLKGNLTIRSPISFKKIKTKNLYTNDFISGINFKEWQQKSLKNNIENYQEITGNWSINNLYVEGNVEGTGIVNGIHMEKLLEFINMTDSEFSDKLNKLKREFMEQCHLAEEYFNHKKIEEKDYFKYFTNTFALTEEHLITHLEFFKHLGKNFLLVNTGCYSNVYVWNIDMNMFEIFQQFETGHINEIVKIYFDYENLYLITNSHLMTYECRISGSNIWLFNHNNKISHYATIGKPGIYSMIRENSGKIYLISQNSLLETDLKFSTNTSWQLPVINTKNPLDNSYRFLPSEINLGIALSDGKQLILLNPQSRRMNEHILKRKKREKFDFLESALKKNDELKLKGMIDDLDDDDSNDSHSNESGELSSNVQKQIKEIIQKVIIGLIHELEVIKSLEQNDSNKNENDHIKSDSSEEDIEDILKYIKKLGYTLNDSITLNTKNISQHNHHQLQLKFNSVKKISKNVAKKLLDGIKDLNDIKEFTKNEEEIYKKFKTILNNSSTNGEHYFNVKSSIFDPSSIDHSIEIMINGIKNVVIIIKKNQNKLKIGNDKNDKYNKNEQIIASDALTHLENYIEEIIKKLLIQEGVIINNNDDILYENNNNNSSNISMEYLLQKGHEYGKKIFDFLIQNSQEGDDLKKDTITKSDNDNIDSLTLSSVTTTTTPTTLMIDEIYNEPIIGLEIPQKGILTADNSFLPSRKSGEIIVLSVGTPKNRIQLIAISKIHDHFIDTDIKNDQNDLINIYYDIIDGNLFQTIYTKKPSQLTVLHLGDETILAFIENNYVIRIFEYQGVQGFIENSKLHFKNKIQKLIPIQLDTYYRHHNDHQFNYCEKKFLAVAIENQIQFFEAIMNNNCNEKKLYQINCSDW